MNYKVCTVISVFFARMTLFLSAFLYVYRFIRLFFSLFLSVNVGLYMLLCLLFYHCTTMNIQYRLYTVSQKVTAFSTIKSFPVCSSKRYGILFHKIAGYYDPFQNLPPFLSRLAMFPTSLHQCL